jgi:hypothetical protein
VKIETAGRLGPAAQATAPPAQRRGFANRDPKDESYHDSCQTNSYPNLPTNNLSVIHRLANRLYKRGYFPLSHSSY